MRRSVAHARQEEVSTEVAGPPTGPALAQGAEEHRIGSPQATNACLPEGEQPDDIFELHEMAYGTGAFPAFDSDDIETMLASGQG